MTNLQPLEFNSTKIRVDDKDRVSMTDLWKASGKNPNQQVRFWISQEASQEFIKTLVKAENSTVNTVLNTKRGRTGGTFAHPQIALAYAKYLSPELHMYVNQVFFERLEEDANPELGISRSHERAVKTWTKQGRTPDWIEHRLNAIATTNQFNSTLGKHGDDARVFPKCANAINVEIIGESAKVGQFY
ncbi:KilA-N domain-containing protein [Anaerosinus massiliensis]|uniref:KilA-N domain-containing protein n=1 Tax=Massilibacillus massiliensis TaxID=1806837 RepID=UPI000DA61F67|nr:KilA-N domain-containing protein [Massilibacillus massiliensis]